VASKVSLDCYSDASSFCYWLFGDCSESSESGTAVGGVRVDTLKWLPTTDGEFVPRMCFPI
jgi:hypothetical protein